MIARTRINLTTTDAVGDPVPVGTNTVAVVQIVGPGTSNWSSGVASLQYSLEIGQDLNGISLESWTAFSPTVTFTSTTAAQSNIAVTGLGYLRLKCTTAQSAALDNANVIWRLQ